MGPGTPGRCGLRRLRHVAWPRGPGCSRSLTKLRLCLRQGWGPIYKVVVNADNPVASMPRDQFIELYTRRRPWSEDLPSELVARPPNSAIRRAFTRDHFHRRSVSTIEAYWHRLEFTGRGTVPIKLDSDEEVLAWVRERRGGFGYVSADVVLGEGVRVLEITEARVH